MGKSSKKKLEARLTEADAGLRDLESARAALSEELRSERERHAEETATLRSDHEQLLDKIKRSTQEELTRVGDELAEARAALEQATEENSRDLRDRDEHARTLLQDLDAAVGAAFDQLSGALARIRDATPAAPSVTTPEDEGVAEVNTHAEAEAPGGVDAPAVAEDVSEPDAPVEDAAPADPPGDDDEAASYEDDWYRFLKHTQGL